MSALTLVASADERLATVRGYVKRGFKLVFWPSDFGKGPREPGWQEKEYQVEDYCDGLNVGTKTGVEIELSKFLLDVDFDWPEGLPMVKRLLPTTGFGFGHGDRTISHAFYTTSTPIVSLKYDDLDNKPFVELRGTKADGTIGYQTMLPPSLHPSRERVELRMDGEIAHDDNVPRRVVLYAIACILLKYLGDRGLLHDVRLAVPGFLLELGLTEQEVTDVCVAVAHQTGNDVSDVAPSVQDTARKIRAGQPVTGANTLKKAIGPDGAKVIARIKRWLSDDVVLGDGDIRMEGGKLSEIVDRAEDALRLSRNVSIYSRGGALVRPIRLDTVAGADVRRAVGATVLLAVREAWLIEQLGLVLRWYRGNSLSDPQAIYARTLLGRGEWRFPVLRSIVAAPTLDRDGRIIETPGFDLATGLLLDFSEGEFPPVPLNPTQDEARAALEKLAHPLRKFPFVDDAARSVALAAILTALVRASLTTAPMVGFDAPTAGTGKSLLAELVGLLATGVRPPALSQGKTDEEDEKRLATVLFAGDPIIHIDNCERQVSGDFLCSMTTQPVVQARILGQSERRILPSTSLVLLSGNNLTFAGDTSRRAVVCRLDANVERPDARTFDFDCHAEVLAARADLVVAGLTVLRAYHVAGRPERLTPMGSFADWDWVRGALVWLGCADPADTRSAILGNDPRRDELLDVMGLWQDAIGEAPIEVAEIAKRAESGDEGSAMRLLHDKLVEVACRGGSWSGKSVGWWLRRHRDRVVAGNKCFRCQDGGRNGQQWSLSMGKLPFGG